MKFELDLKGIKISNEDILEDIVRVASLFGRTTLTYREYKEHGKYSANVAARRFGSWNNARQKAGLTKGKQYRITDAELFKNLEEVWIRLGRQPRYEEIIKPVSKYSSGAYEYRFRTWNEALKAFVSYINGPEPTTSVPIVNLTIPTKAVKPPRGISDRLRFIIMKRDNFKCQACGRNPSSDPGVILHIDHVKAWSKGGETSPENLQTLCSKCNIGKSDLE